MSQPPSTFAAGVVVGVVAATVIGAVSGAVATWVVTSRARAASARVPLTMQTLVATRTLRVGDVLTKSDLAERPVPLSFVTASVVQTEYASYLVHQVVLTPYAPGEALRWSSLESSRPALPCARQLVERCSSKAAPKTNTDFRRQFGLAR